MVLLVVDTQKGCFNESLYAFETVKENIGTSFRENGCKRRGGRDMKWYLDKYEELKKVTPIISVCGDDCAVCPRFLAKTDEELHETAVFWQKAGWRDHVVTNEEIRCTGCGCRPNCSFMLLPCTIEHGVTMCHECGEFQCEKVKKTLSGSNEKMIRCKEACESEKEFELLKRAFYEKEKNMHIQGFE